jgi:hypothetical protein
LYSPINDIRYNDSQVGDVQIVFGDGSAPAADAQPGDPGAYWMSYSSDSLYWDYDGRVTFTGTLRATDAASLYVDPYSGSFVWSVSAVEVGVRFGGDRPVLVKDASFATASDAAVWVRDAFARVYIESGVFDSGTVANIALTQGAFVASVAPFGVQSCTLGVFDDESSRNEIAPNGQVVVKNGAAYQARFIPSYDASKRFAVVGNNLVYTLVTPPVVEVRSSAVNFTAASAVEVGEGVYEITLDYLAAPDAIRQTIVGKVNLGDPEWTDLTERGLIESTIGATRAVIPASVKDKDENGVNYRFFKRRVWFQE